MREPDLGKLPVHRVRPIPSASSVKHLEENTAAALLELNQETREALDLRAA